MPLTMFSLEGIGDNVQLGKEGPRLENKTDHIEARTADDLSLINVAGADPRSGTAGQQDFITRNYFDSHAGSVNVTLQTPADGTFLDGAITSWVIGSTTVSTAVDDLNEVLGKLVPALPDNLSSKTIATTGGSNQLVCSGATNRTSATLPSAGSSVYTVFSSSMTSTLASGGTSGAYCYDAAAGTLSALVNGSSAGSIAFDNTIHPSVTQNNGALQLSLIHI